VSFENKTTNPPADTNTSQVVDDPQLMAETAILVKFQTAPGSSYTLEESTDLENWSDGITDIVGNGGVMKLFFEITTPRKFYRLKPSVE
jgi:hypothetical protein